jgi:hypothetical protein
MFVDTTYPMSQSRDYYARIPVDPETRDALKAQKVGGESYDEMLQRVLGILDEAGELRQIPSDAGED